MTTVYVADKDTLRKERTKYHRKECLHYPSTPVEMDEEQAIEQGLTLCLYCSSEPEITGRGNCSHYDALVKANPEDI